MVYERYSISVCLQVSYRKVRVHPILAKFILTPNIYIRQIFLPLSFTWHLLHLLRIDCRPSLMDPCMGRVLSSYNSVLSL